jgi:aerobic carbon-monoxide dehydrogenase large subunit
MVRSPHAHGILGAVDVEPAKAMPGVLAVYTAKDLEGYGPHRCLVSLPGLKVPERRALASDKVRYVGDPVACVIAESAAAARDAAESIVLDIEPLPAVTRTSEAAAAGAPQLYDEVPGNVAAEFHYGDADKVAAAFARAAHVAKLALRNTRVIPAPIEPRAALCTYDAAAGRWTLRAPGQGVMRMKNQLAEILGVAPDKVRMLTPHVGGSFGMKGSIYPEYVCLAHAARALARPVKWTDERSGSFVSDSHGRDHETSGELALDADGRFLALRLTVDGNAGAWLSIFGPQPPTVNAVRNSIGMYRTPLLEVRSRVVLTNTSPVGAYRGAGRPEANYYTERLIDAAAAAMGIDRIALRRRNLVRADEMPYHNAADLTYDSGEFEAVLQEALRLADVEHYPARKQRSESRGRLRGLGIGNYVEATAAGGKEFAAIRFESDGGVTLATGTLDFGQGHAAAFMQVLAAELGVPPARVRLVQGDSDALAFGGGTGGSRSIMLSGAAIVQAAAIVVQKGKEAAAEALEAAAADIEFHDGRFRVAGTDRAIGLLELARKAKLDVAQVSEVIPAAFPNGCHVAEVEIDPETGTVEIARYASVNDFGTVVNPLLVEGQVHGGVVQGIGQCLMEEARYDETGQLLTGSFMDYALPRAADIGASIEWRSHPVPARTNPLGAKGCGEAGCAGAMTSVMNAIVDALSAYGITRFDMPATPRRVWEAIQRGKLSA